MEWVRVCLDMQVRPRDFDVFWYAFCLHSSSGRYQGWPPAGQERNTQMIYTHILVPTDFSPAAHRALVYALEEATLHQAKLTLLHVIQHHPTTEVYYVKDAPQGGTGYVGEFGHCSADSEIALDRASDVFYPPSPDLFLRRETHVRTG